MQCNKVLGIRKRRRGSSDDALAVHCWDLKMLDVSSSRNRGRIALGEEWSKAE